jgi:small multidrug resistance family-3 protein
VVSSPGMFLGTLLLFVATAAAELVGCYLPFLWLRRGGPAWYLPLGLVSLAVFAWLLTLHLETSAGRVYAAYGGVYVASAVVWLWLIDGQPPDRWDVLGALVSIGGMAIIFFGPRG